MSSDSIRSDLARLQTRRATLLGDQAKAERAAASAKASARQKRESAARTKSASTQRSALAAAERFEKKAADEDKKVGDIAGKIAGLDKQIATKERSLTTALKSDQTKLDREAARRRRTELDHVRTVAAASNPVVRYVPIPTPKPEPLRVLYLTSNPDSVETKTVDSSGAVTSTGVWLRVDKEVRAVQQAIRSSNFRDLVDIKHMPAATREDILTGLNDFRPHIVHFSGHGGGQSLYMDDDGVEDGGRFLTFELLAKVLSATTTPPVLLVLNACETLDGAEVLIGGTPVVIAMSESITDEAAILFAKQFYTAIGSAQSVGRAFEQGKLAIEISELGEEHTPEILCRDDADIETLILVKQH